MPSDSETNETPREPDADLSQAEAAPEALGSTEQTEETEAERRVETVPPIDPFELPGFPEVTIHPDIALDPAALPPGLLPPPPHGFPGFIPPTDLGPGRRVVWVAATVPVYARSLEQPEVGRRTPDTPRADYSQLSRDKMQLRATEVTSTGETAPPEPSQVSPVKAIISVGVAAALLTLSAIGVVKLGEVLVQSEPTAGSIESPLDIALTVDNIAGLYLEANSGRESLSQMSTLLLRGEFIQGEESFEVYNLKRRPSDFFFRLSQGDLQISTGITPRDAWSSVENIATGRRIVNDLEAEVAQAYRGFVHFFHPFTQFAIDGAGTVTDFEVSETDEGERLARISFRPAGTERTYEVELFGPNLVMRSSRYVDDDGNELRSEYTDYQQISGFWIPMNVVNYRNGEESNRIILETAQVNPGLISLVFDRPDSVEIRR